MRVAALVLILSPALIAQTAVEIDKTVSRVYETAIMSSDVRQIRLLRLPDAAANSDREALLLLENRLLMLREAARGEVAEPTPDQIAARRKAWESSLAPGTDLPALLRRAGMSDRALDGWFRDDLLIQAHIQQRFGDAEPRRAERVAAWITTLRLRANLK
jgi:hypothetical protein